MPGVLKVNEKLCPGAKLSEFQIPVSLVTVWVLVAEVLIQVTVSPAEIVRVEGWKAKSTMSIIEAEGGVVGEVIGEVRGAALENGRKNSFE